MTSTAEAPTEAPQLVSQPDTSALFMATRSNLRLVKKAIRTIRGPEGEAVDQTLGETLEFNEGVLRVPLAPDGEVTCLNGERIPAPDVLAWLGKHRMNGDWQEGFWRVDPTAPPPSQEELDTLQELAIDLNDEGLTLFVEQERAGWNRPQLIEIAERTLEKIAAKAAELTAAHEQELAEAEARGAAAATIPKGGKSD